MQHNVCALKSISIALRDRESLLEGEDSELNPEGKVGTTYVKGAEKIVCA